MGRDSRSRSRKRSRSGSPKRKHDKGTINTWQVDKQFGFVSCDGGGPDVFVHAEQVADEDKRWDAKKKGLRRGDRISFDIKSPQPGKKSLQAQNIEILEYVKRSRSPSRRRSRSRRRSPSRRRSRGRSGDRGDRDRGGRGGGGGGGRQQERRPGDWECTKCGDLQFARNMECRKCGEPKPRDDSRGRRSPSRRRRTRSDSRRR
eukprot:TRINITY_DN47334_c0_g1_i1.p1 TRINITY_DN47334_c0_g1~~TRINITY_DN47334_c0_g1_i1.p1  ORF type:complete len:216 (-),score=26.56 TRINITY_DN47334_c0_g1_i1:213-821(-)